MMVQYVMCDMCQWRECGVARVPRDLPRILITFTHRSGQERWHVVLQVNWHGRIENLKPAIYDS